MPRGLPQKPPLWGQERSQWNEQGPYPIPGVRSPPRLKGREAHATDFGKCHRRGRDKNESKDKPRHLATAFLRSATAAGRVRPADSSEWHPQCAGEEGDRVGVLSSRRLLVIGVVTWSLFHSRCEDVPRRYRPHPEWRRAAREPPVCCWNTSMVSSSSISSWAGVSASLIGCPSNLNLICLIDKPCRSQ